MFIQEDLIKAIMIKPHIGELKLPNCVYERLGFFFVFFIDFSTKLSMNSFLLAFTDNAKFVLFSGLQEVKFVAEKLS